MRKTQGWIGVLVFVVYLGVVAVMAWESQAREERKIDEARQQLAEPSEEWYRAYRTTGEERE